MFGVTLYLAEGTLNQPIYKRRCEENELEWEANHSDIMNNYGDWRD